MEFNSFILQIGKSWKTQTMITTIYIYIYTSEEQIEVHLSNDEVSESFLDASEVEERITPEEYYRSFFSSS